MSRDAKKQAPLPYEDWWQTVGRRTLRRRREVVFQTGRAPINLPPHPARLELIRDVAPFSEDFSGTSTAQLLTHTAPAGFFGAKTGVQGRHIQKSSLPRSFSGECCQVINDQAPIEFFDSLAVYRSCPLFQRCSPGFIQKLMSVGGKSACHGKIFECGSTIYPEGQRGSCMYLIVRGTIALVPASKLLGPGDCIGVAQGLGVVAERQETAIAETSVHVLEITLSALTTIFTEKEEFHSSTCFGGESWGNYYTHERRLFELEARRLRVEKAAKTRRMKREATDTTKATKTLKRLTMQLKKHHAEESDPVPELRPPANPPHISCLQHPRQWRQQVQKLQRELIDGDFSEFGRARREAFLQSLSASLTQDFNSGYQQPLDSPFRAAMEDRHTPQLEEEIEEVTSGMLELSLLPGFPEMSCKQKVDLFHHMNAQNKAHAASPARR